MEQRCGSPDARSDAGALIHAATDLPAAQVTDLGRGNNSAAYGVDDA